MGQPDPPEIRPRVHQQLPGEAGVPQVPRLRRPLVPRHTARMVAGVRQPVHVPHPREHRPGPLQLPNRLVAPAALLQRLPEVVLRPGLAARVLRLPVPGQRLPQPVHRRPRIPVHHPGPAQLRQRPGLTAVVAGAPVQLQRQPQLRLRRLHVPEPQVHLTQLEMRPRLPVHALALPVQRQRGLQQPRRLRQVRPVPLHRRQGVQTPRPVTRQLRRLLQHQSLPDPDRRLRKIALVVQGDAERDQGHRRPRLLIGLHVLVDHRGQRGAGLVQLAQLARRDTRTPLHRTHQPTLLPRQPLLARCHRLRQLVDLTQPVQVPAQQAEVAQGTQQIEHRLLVHPLRMPQRRRDEARLVVQPAQRRIQRGETVPPELARPRRHLPVDHPDHRVRELRVVTDQPLVRRRGLRPVILVPGRLPVPTPVHVHVPVSGRPRRRVRTHRVVHPEALAAHPLDQSRLPQLLQRAQRRRLRYVGQRGRRRTAQRRPPGQRQPSQQLPGRPRQPGVGRAQRRLHRMRRHRSAAHQGPALTRQRSQHPQREREPTAQLHHRGHVLLRHTRPRRREQLRRLLRSQPLHRQLVHPRRQIGRQLQRLPRRHQHQALGTLRHQQVHLRRVHRIVQQHRHGQPAQVLVVQLTEATHLLLRRRSLTEQQLLAGRPQPVHQVQQRLTRRQRRLP
ncbi:hypothetical protein SAVIM40S_07696 [Streptomyces avidinii]